MNVWVKGRSAVKTVLKNMQRVKNESQNFFCWFGGHFQCILELRELENRLSKASTSRVSSELILIFLESVGPGEWDYLVTFVGGFYQY